MKQKNSEMMVRQYCKNVFGIFAIFLQVVISTDKCANGAELLQKNNFNIFAILRDHHFGEKL